MGGEGKGRGRRGGENKGKFKGGEGRVKIGTITATVGFICCCF